jgi:uncharacterized protein YbjT (DUF2867 family)
MKILVIGASGLLARPVISQFNKEGFQLRLFSRTVNQSIFEKKYEIVNGDAYNLKDLDRAMDGCDAVHISLATRNEGLATKNIVDVARQKGIKLISKVSGCTVAEENRWFPMIENKYQAEQSIISSGIPYMIFRPSWFFETLDLMIREGKAMMLGKQPYPAHWIAAGDFARMVVSAYKNPDARNRIFFIFGQEQYLMKDLLEKYCQVCYPEINKVSMVPIWMAKFIAILTGNKGLKEAASLFGYFEKVKELGNPDETDALLGKPTITFENWVESKAR